MRLSGWRNLCARCCVGATHFVAMEILFQCCENKQADSNDGCQEVDVDAMLVVLAGPVSFPPRGQ